MTNRQTLKTDAISATRPVELGRGLTCGDKPLWMVAGPCAVESLEQLESVACRLTMEGVRSLRGGAFKPRTSPYSFQGMGLEGLQLMHQVGRENDLAVVTEIMSLSHLEDVVAFADVLQVGSRNMQNFDLLKALGQVDKPVLLKRGFSATIDEFLWAAEYIMAGGNERVILCERGIRSFDTETRNVLDLGAVAVLKEMSHLPVIVDPSHAAGRRDIIPALSRAAVAVGADGLIVEIHPHPERSVSDAAQALSLEAFSDLMAEVEGVAAAMGRSLRVDTLTALVS